MAIYISIDQVGDPETVGGVADALNTFQQQYPGQAVLRRTNADVAFLNSVSGAVDPTIFTNLATWIGTYGMVVLNLTAPSNDVSNV